MSKNKFYLKGLLAILVVGVTMTFVNGDYNIKNSIELIKTKNRKELIKYFSSKVVVSSGATSYTIMSNNEYQINNDNNELYAVLFDTEKCRKIFDDSKVYCFQEALLKTTSKISFYTENKENEKGFLPQIAFNYAGRYYNIMLDNTDQGLKIGAFEITD